MNKLTKSQIEILTDNYSNWYGIPKAWSIYMILWKNMVKKYYIYKPICKIIGNILEKDEKNWFVKCIIRKTLYYLKKWSKILDIKVLKWTKI